MEWVVTELMGDRSEVVRYDRPGLPLYIRTGELSHFLDMRAPCHWHDDIELIRVLSGRMRYHINGREILLDEGDSVAVNSRQMHFGYDFQRAECRYHCILFHPSLFTGGQTLERDFILPILTEQTPEYWLMPAGTELGGLAADCVDRIVRLKARGRGAYELEAVGLLHILWAGLWRDAEEDFGSGPYHRDPDVETQKEMAAYIGQHYGEKLTLEELAAVGHVSRSKCCQIFRRFMGRTPIEYVNTYRLKLSRDLLAETEKSVTEIALACGFNHLSYFSRIFFRTFGATPSEYRAQIRRGPCAGRETCC